jgi:hypothetical protein
MNLKGIILRGKKPDTKTYDSIYMELYSRQIHLQRPGAGTSVVGVRELGSQM